MATGAACVHGPGEPPGVHVGVAEGVTEAAAVAVGVAVGVCVAVGVAVGVGLGQGIVSSSTVLTVVFAVLKPSATSTRPSGSVPCACPARLPIIAGPALNVPLLMVKMRGNTIRHCVDQSMYAHSLSPVLMHLYYFRSPENWKLTREQE